VTDTPARQRPVRTQIRVLFVDDEPYVLAGLTDLLRGRYQVTTATSGTEALRIIVDSEPFSVIVSDFAMPGMSGAEFLGQARHASPDAIRLLLTGQATLEGAASAINEGQIFRFLIKPCSGSHLIQALDDAVEQYRLVTADRQLLEHKLGAMSSHLVRVERLASLGTMSAAVGHELNNVIAGFEGALGLVEDDMANGLMPDREQLSILRRVQEQLSLHARNLLHFGRPSQETRPITDLTDCLRDVLEMLRLGGRLSTVQVKLDVPIGRVVVAMERSSSEQVLLNLIKNAVEALEGTGNPTIMVSIARAEIGRTVVCTVSDNGCGIASAQVPLLFEPYFTTKPPDRGTGLGLFVVKDALRKAGGDVSVQSTIGQGTTFSLSIPLVTPTGEAEEPTPVGAARPAQ
jgi:signal transduction histidine kinase